MTIRSFVEQQTHRLVFRRRLPKPFSHMRFYVSSEGGLRYLRPSMDRVDRNLISLVSEFVRRGSIVWDVGANLGLFTFAAAAAAGPDGRVIAVEPDPWLVNLLHRSIRLAQPGRVAGVDVVCAAVADKTGMAAFHVAKRSRSTNYLEGYGTTQTGGTRERRLVPTVTLDALLAHVPAPDVLKIDVEGAETLVLQGGPSVLETGPLIVCEVAGENAHRVGEVLRERGYRFYPLKPPSGPRQEVALPPSEVLAIREH